MTAINWSNMTSPQDFLAAANTNSAGTFWTGMLVLIILVLFLAMISFGAEAALMVSLFIGMMLGIFLLYLGLISPTVVGIITGIEIFMVLYFMYSSRQQQY